MLSQTPLSFYDHVVESDTILIDNYVYVASEFDSVGAIEKFRINLLNECNSESHVVIDINAQNVPDRFAIYDQDSIHIISTPWIGGLGPFYGYVDFLPPSLAMFPTFPPTDHYFYGYPTGGLIRIQINTTSSHLYFLSFLNPQYDSVFEIFVHPPTYTTVPSNVYLHEFIEVCEEEVGDPDTVSISGMLCDTFLVTHYMPLDVEFPYNYQDTIVQVFANYSNSIYYTLSNEVAYISWNEEEGYEYDIDVWGDTLIIVDLITLDGCILSDTINISTYSEQIYIPNIFTPNNDGSNDIFTLYPKSELTKKKLTIFDRWGGIVHRSNDGIWDGDSCLAGVYVYLFELTFLDGTSSIRSGDVTLLR